MQLRTKVLVIFCASLVSLVTAMSAASVIIMIGDSGDILIRVQYLLLSLAAVGLVISIATLLLIDKLVISRMFDLGEILHRIGASNDLSARVPVSGNDEVSRFASIINRALDDLERSQQMLHASERKFRGLVENINDIVWEVDADLKFTYVSPNVREMFGYDPAEAIGKPLYDFMAPEDAEKFRPVADALRSSKTPMSLVEIPLQDRDGGRIDLEVSGTAITDPAGDLVGYHGVARDIRERKAVEKAVRKWADIFHFTKMAIVICSPESTVLEMMNPAFAGMYGYTVDELTGKPTMDIVAPEHHEAMQGHLAIAHETGHHAFECTHIRRDGTRFPVSVDITAVKDREGRVLYRITNVQDITERKRVEETLQKAHDERANVIKSVLEEIAERRRVENQIKASLAEKEVLLKEIHHRVKNNLQIISSLLNLQAESVNRDNAAAAFRESQNRIRSMALIHEKLYQAPDISRVDFAEYVRNLTTYLARSYMASPRVGIGIDIDRVGLDIDKAIPCGLIINELVSNSLKYAFRDGRPGEIRVGLSRSGDTYTLEVSDTGAGLPAGLDFRNTPSLGLQLVNTLVDQLEGRIELGTGKGTTYKITFAERG